MQRAARARAADCQVAESDEEDGSTEEIDEREVEGRRGRGNSKLRVQGRGGIRKNNRARSSAEDEDASKAAVRRAKNR